MSNEKNDEVKEGGAATNDSKIQDMLFKRKKARREVLDFFEKPMKPVESALDKKIKGGTSFIR